MQTHIHAEEFLIKIFSADYQYFATSNLLYNISTYTNKNNIPILKYAFLPIIYFYMSLLCDVIL